MFISLSDVKLEIGDFVIFFNLIEFLLMLFFFFNVYFVNSDAPICLNQFLLDNSPVYSWTEKLIAKHDLHESSFEL